MAATHIGLIFHGIGDPQRKLEAGEAPYWISVKKFETILAMIQKLPAPERIRISFDDGNLSDHDIALPRLVERGLTADFFPLFGRVGQAGSLNASHIRALEAAGMRVGSHGVAHVNWSMLDAGALKNELQQSRVGLGAICSHPVTAAAIPFGGYNGNVLRQLREEGYTAAYTSDGGRMNPSAFLRPRKSVREDMTEQDLRAHLTGKMGIRSRVRRMIGMVKRRM